MSSRACFATAAAALTAKSAARAGGGCRCMRSPIPSTVGRAWPVEPPYHYGSPCPPRRYAHLITAASTPAAGAFYPVCTACFNDKPQQGLGAMRSKMDLFSHLRCGLSSATVPVAAVAGSLPLFNMLTPHPSH